MKKLAVIFFVTSTFLFFLNNAVVMGSSGHKHHGSGKAVDDDDWAAPPKAARRINPIPKSPESIASGGALFGEHCAMCHGKEGRGNGPAAKNSIPKPTNLAAMGKSHSAGDIAWKIETGKKQMPAWKDTLTENQIWDIVNYIRSLKR